MRGSKSLFTTDDAQKMFVQHLCSIEAAYSCILSRLDDSVCVLNNTVYKDCMQTFRRQPNHKLKYDKSIISQDNNRGTSIKPSD